MDERHWTGCSEAVVRRIVIGLDLAALACFGMSKLRYPGSDEWDVWMVTGLGFLGVSFALHLPLARGRGQAGG